MPGLEPGIHSDTFQRADAFVEWIAGSSPAMTCDESALEPPRDLPHLEAMTIQTRPQVMRLTEAAAERLRALAAAAGKDMAGVRIGVKNGGCAGMEYTMSYAETRGPHDEVIEDKGVKLLIDPTAVMFLLGTEMDYRTDRMRSGFVFNNPNQTSSCGCGESVALKPAAAQHDSASE
jgi:iron-sulfur cluster assembly protein